MKALITMVAVTLPLAGCVTDPNVTVGKPDYVRLSDNRPVSITDPALQPVRQGCIARYQSISGTNSALYGSASYLRFTDEIDDLRNCFARHGYRLAYRQPNGKLTPYPYHDKRLDF